MRTEGEWQTSPSRTPPVEVVRELALRSRSLGGRSFETGSARTAFRPNSDQKATFCLPIGRVGYDYIVLRHGSYNNRLSTPSWLSTPIQDPSRRTDVLKGRSDAKPDELVGRLENMVKDVADRPWCRRSGMTPWTTMGKQRRPVRPTKGVGHATEPEDAAERVAGHCGRYVACSRYRGHPRLAAGGSCNCSSFG